MKIERVTYKKIFPLAPYINEQVGIEAILEEGDTPEQALSSLKKVAEEWHKQANPGIVIEAGQQVLPVIQRGVSKDEQDVEFNIWKTNVINAATKEDALEIIKASGNWKVPLEFQTRETVNKKPNKK
jgi:hypothetical protein